MAFFRKRFASNVKPPSGTKSSELTSTSSSSSSTVPKIDLSLPQVSTLLEEKDQQKSSSKPTGKSTTTTSNTKSSTTTTTTKDVNGNEDDLLDDRLSDLDVWVDLGTPPPELGKRIERARIGPKQCIRLVRACSKAIKERGLETLGIFRPFRSAEHPEVIRRILSVFLEYEDPNISNNNSSTTTTTTTTSQSPSPPSSRDPLTSAFDLPPEWISDNRKPSFEDEIEKADIHDVVAIFKWGLRHLVYPGNGFSGDPDPFAFYAHFRANEAARLNTPEAYRYCFIPIVPNAHSKLVSLIVDLISHVAARSDSNAMTGSRLCHLLGFWIFGCANHRDKAYIEGKRERPYDQGLQDLYYEWKVAGTCLEHLFLAWLRIQKDLPLKLEQLIKSYPPPPAQVDRDAVTCLRATVLTQGDWDKNTLDVAGHPPDPLVARWQQNDRSSEQEANTNLSNSKSTKRARKAKSSTAHTYFTTSPPPTNASTANTTNITSNASNEKKVEGKNMLSSGTLKGVPAINIKDKLESKKLMDHQHPTTPPGSPTLSALDRKSAVTILQDALEARKMLFSNASRAPATINGNALQNTINAGKSTSTSSSSHPPANGSDNKTSSSSSSSSPSATQLYEAALDVIEEEDEEKSNKAEKEGSDSSSTVSAGTLRGEGEEGQPSHKTTTTTSVPTVQPTDIWKSILSFAHNDHDNKDETNDQISWGRSLDDPTSILSSEHQFIFKKLDSERAFFSPSGVSSLPKSASSPQLPNIDDSPNRKRSFSFDSPNHLAVPLSSSTSAAQEPSSKSSYDLRLSSSVSTTDWASFASLGFQSDNEVDKDKLSVGNFSDFQSFSTSEKRQQQNDASKKQGFSPLSRFQSAGSQRKKAQGASGTTTTATATAKPAYSSSAAHNNTQKQQKGASAAHQENQNDSTKKTPFTVITSLSYVRIEETFADVWLDAMGDPDIIARWPYFVFSPLSDAFLRSNNFLVPVEKSADNNNDGGDTSTTSPSTNNDAATMSTTTATNANNANARPSLSKVSWILVEQHLHPFLQNDSKSKRTTLDTSNDSTLKVPSTNNQSRPLSPTSMMSSTSSGNPKRSLFSFGKRKQDSSANKRLSGFFGLSRSGSVSEQHSQDGKVVLSWDDPRLPDLMAQEHRAKNPDVADKDMPDFAAMIGQDTNKKDGGPIPESKAPTTIIEEKEPEEESQPEQQQEQQNNNTKENHNVEKDTKKEQKEKQDAALASSQPQSQNLTNGHSENKTQQQEKNKLVQNDSKRETGQEKKIEKQPIENISAKRKSVSEKIESFESKEKTTVEPVKITPNIEETKPTPVSSPVPESTSTMASIPTPAPAPTNIPAPPELPKSSSLSSESSRPVYERRLSVETASRSSKSSQDKPARSLRDLPNTSPHSFTTELKPVATDGQKDTKQNDKPPSISGSKSSSSNVNRVSALVRKYDEESRKSMDTDTSSRKKSIDIESPRETSPRKSLNSRPDQNADFIQELKTSIMNRKSGSGIPNSERSRTPRSSDLTEKPAPSLSESSQKQSEASQKEEEVKSTDLGIKSDVVDGSTGSTSQAEKTEDSKSPLTEEEGNPLEKPGNEEEAQAKGEEVAKDEEPKQTEADDSSKPIVQESTVQEPVVAEQAPIVEKPASEEPVKGKEQKDEEPTKSVTSSESSAASEEKLEQDDKTTTEVVTEKEDKQEEISKEDGNDKVDAQQTPVQNENETTLEKEFPTDEKKELGSPSTVTVTSKSDDATNVSNEEQNSKKATKKLLRKISQPFRKKKMSKESKYAGDDQVQSEVPPPVPTSTTSSPTSAKSQVEQEKADPTPSDATPSDTTVEVPVAENNLPEDLETPPAAMATDDNQQSKQEKEQDDHLAASSQKSLSDAASIYSQSTETKSITKEETTIESEKPKEVVEEETSETNGNEVVAGNNNNTDNQKRWSFTQTGTELPPDSALASLKSDVVEKSNISDIEKDFSANDNTSVNGNEEDDKDGSTTRGRPSYEASEASFQTAQVPPSVTTSSSDRD